LRFVPLITSLLLIAATSAEINTGGQATIGSACAVYVCDDSVVTSFAYHLQLAGTPADTKMSVEFLQRLLIRDPASPRRWADLGSALFQAGRQQKAQLCFQRAVELGGNSAGILVSAGDFFLQIGDQARGLRWLCRTVMLTADYDDAVFSYYSQRGVDFERVLIQGLPANTRVALAYLRYLMQQPDANRANKLWKWMALRSLTDDSIAAEFSGFLLQDRRFDEAASVWGNEIRSVQPDYGKNEFVYNGGFRFEPVTGAVFDWKIEPVHQVEVTREKENSQERRGLRVHFDGTENLSYANISQKTVVPPGRYQLRADVQSEALTTDEGVFFRVFDVSEQGRLNVQTDQVLGTTAPHSLDATFEVKQKKCLLEVCIVRKPSWRFDNKISGTVWIHRVSITPIK
jgi:hypothetical protein